MPSIAIACSYILVASTAAVDSEVEGYYAVAANGIGGGECRFGSARGVGIAVPHKAITGGHRLRT